MFVIYYRDSEGRLQHPQGWNIAGKTLFNKNGYGSKKEALDAINELGNKHVKYIILEEVLRKWSKKEEEEFLKNNWFK